MLIEETTKKNKPHLIYDKEGKELDKFIFQKFDKLYLENLLNDVISTRKSGTYELTPIPKGKQYGYLVVIRP